MAFALVHRTGGGDVKTTTVNKDADGVFPSPPVFFPGQTAGTGYAPSAGGKYGGVSRVFGSGTSGVTAGGEYGFHPPYRAGGLCGVAL